MFVVFVCTVIGASYRWSITNGSDGARKSMNFPLSMTPSLDVSI